jgi:hypothetical protein
VLANASTHPINYSVPSAPGEGNKMKLMKMLGLAAMAALTSMALVGVSSAAAETTALCKALEEPCSSANLIKNVTEATLTGKKAQLKSILGTVECDVLLEGEVKTAGLLGASLLIEGHFKYSNCNLGCVAAEPTGGISKLTLTKTAFETGEVTGSGQVKIDCTLINFHCLYNGEGLKGTALGPDKSNAEMPNGEVFLKEQVTHAVEGTNCPPEAKLTINVGPETTKTFISS